MTTTLGALQHARGRKAICVAIGDLLPVSATWRKSTSAAQLHAIKRTWKENEENPPGWMFPVEAAAPSGTTLFIWRNSSGSSPPTIVNPNPSGLFSMGTLCRVPCSLSGSLVNFTPFASSSSSSSSSPCSLKNWATLLIEVLISSHVHAKISFETKNSFLSLLLALFSPECPMHDWLSKSCWPIPLQNGPEVVQGPGGVITYPTLLGPVLVWSQQNNLRLLLSVRYSKSS